MRSPLAQGYMPDLHDRITGASAASGIPKPNAASKQKQSNGKFILHLYDT